MLRKDFYFDLPPEQIAQHPTDRRDACRLLILDRETGAVTDAHFFDIPAQLHAGDCLILNDSRVIPARLYGVREDTGSPVELLLLTDRGGDVWEVLAGPGKKARPGMRLVFAGGRLIAEVQQVLENGHRMVHFIYDGPFYPLLEEIGQIPLPHYITEELTDAEKYQTVYARERGSVAAPTAGLHFTPELLQAIRDKGVQIGFVTLHVGVGTFRPVKADRVEDHHMHAEHYALPPETAQLINRTRAAGGRVIACGTTACRTIESVGVEEDGLVHAAAGWTDIFIYPGYRFKVLDALITNFHLPESTLIMLVSAFAGREHVMAAYKHAVKAGYRFFSFGDAMFIR